jgi:multidrug efflux system membrane fusion protein
VASAARADVPVYLDAVGTIKALNTVTVSPQVDGKLLNVNYQEGQDVKKGDILARIDPVIYQAQLDQAVAKKAQDAAQLANSKLDLESYEKLSRQQRDQQATGDTKRALVAQTPQLCRPIGGNRECTGPSRLHHHHSSTR